MDSTTTYAGPGKSSIFRKPLQKSANKSLPLKPASSEQKEKYRPGIEAFGIKHLGKALGKYVGGKIGKYAGKHLGKHTGIHENEGEKHGENIVEAIGGLLPFKKGGPIKKNGKILAHKGEFILPKGVSPTSHQLRVVKKKHK